MADLPLNPHPCILCDELVYISDDEKTWGIEWINGWVHYRCVYNLFNAVRRVQGKPEVSLIDDARELLKDIMARQDEIQELILKLSPRKGT